MQSQISISSYDYPVDKLSGIKSFLFSVIRNISVTKFELQRRLNYLDKVYRRSWKENPVANIENGVMNSFIYGNDMNEFQSIGKEKEMIASLRQENDSFWQELAQSFLREDEMVIQLTKPNKNNTNWNWNFWLNLMGLPGRGESADEAKLSKEARSLNNQKLYIPSETSKLFPLPRASSLFSPKVVTLRSRQMDPNFPSPKNARKISGYIQVSNSSYALQVSHYESQKGPGKTQLIIYAHLDVSELRHELKHYLVLYFMSLRKAGLRPGMTLFASGAVFLAFYVDEGDFVSTLERLKGVLSEIRNFEDLTVHDFPQIERAYFFYGEILFLRSMIPKLWSFHVNDTALFLNYDPAFYEMVASDFRNNHARKTIGKLKEINQFVIEQKRVAFHIAGNIQSIAEANSDLEAILNENLGAYKQLDNNTLTSFCQSSQFETERLGKARVVIVSAEKIQQPFNRWRGLPSFAMIFAEESNHINNDSPIELLTDRFFKEIRNPPNQAWQKLDGSGSLNLVFSTHSSEPEYANIGTYYELFVIDAINVNQTFKEMKRFVDALSDGYAPLAMSFERARKNLIYELTVHASPRNIVRSNIFSCIFGHSRKYSEEFLDGILNATLSNVAKLLQERLQPFFDASDDAQIIIIAGQNSQVDGLRRDFEQMGFVVEEMEEN